MKTALVTALAVASVVLSSCTSEGASPPPTTPSTQSSHTERPKLAPPIERELDLSKKVPCDLLSEVQHKALGFPAGGGRGLESMCTWHAPQADLSIVLFDDQNALQDTYNVLQGVSYNVFQPVTLANQPAVVYTAYQGAPTCNVSVGIAHDQGMTLMASGERPNTDWCAMAKTAATDVVHNLGG